jgi:CIC family chloride channel protein
MDISKFFRFDWTFYGLPIVVGILAGFGAIVFRRLTGLVHNIAMEGKLGFIINEHEPLTSIWGYGTLFLPAIGFVIVVFILRKFSPESQGHGVPEVMAAVYANKGKIPPGVAGFKTLASAITLGTGGSAGDEGPIVQIGASLGSAVGQKLHLSGIETITLLGCGAAAGIAAIFNAPLGGILFAVELILPEFSVRTMVPLALSTSIGTYISRYFLGDEPAFSVPHYALSSGYELPLYILLGILVGILAIVYIKMLHNVEEAFQKWKVNTYVKPLVGGLIVGVSGVSMYYFFGQYYVYGVGYSTISEILHGNAGYSVLFLLLLTFMKMFATSFTLGSGGSGGILAPALFVGAAFGAAFGTAAGLLFPGSIEPSAYANVGMGAMLGGMTGASLTAIILFFEITRDYSIILPLTIGVFLARAFVHHHHEGTIYELSLLKRGIKIPHERAIDTLSIVPVKEIMDVYRGDETNLMEIYQYAPVLDALVIMNEKRVNDILVVNKSGTPVGVIHKDDVLYLYTRERVATRKSNR